MNDLRLPIGIFFAILGIILIAAPAHPAPMAGAQVNVYTGSAMLVFGGVMLWLARRAS